MMTRSPTVTLRQLQQRERQCHMCPLREGCSQVVPGDGPVPCTFMLVGEAPGFDEDRLGKPFVGASGRLLDKTLSAAGMSRDRVFVTNVARCLAAQTVVLTPFGWKRVGWMYRHNYDGLVGVVDSEGMPSWSRVVARYRNPIGNRRLVKVSLTHSRHAHGGATDGIFTDDHLMLTARGWVEAGQLKSTDLIHTGTVQPSQTVRSALCGMMLGDIGCHTQASTFTWMHGGKQAEYLRYKAWLLGVAADRMRITDPMPDVPNGRIRFSVPTSMYWRMMARVYYPGGVRRLPNQCPEEFGLISLAYLFMDNGYIRFRVGRRPDAEIAVCYMSPADAERLSSWINQLGVSCHVGNSRYQRIKFNVDATEHLSRLIAPYVPQCMEQKLIPVHRDIEKMDIHAPLEPFFDTCQVIPTSPGNMRSVYCLQVEHESNFITLSGVVHNCRPPGNRTPEASEIAACKLWLWDEVCLVRPLVIAALGKTPAKLLLRAAADFKISREVGRPQEVDYLRDHGIVVPMYHPSYILRQGKEEVKGMVEILVKCRNYIEAHHESV